MKQPMSRRGYLSLALLCASLLGAGYVTAKDTEKASPSASAVGERALPEKSLGSSTAPLTIIAYSSLTCPHCAEFDKNVLPQLVTKYIDTGKIRFIFRDFPLDGLSLKAAQLAQCVPEGNYFPFIKTVFSGAKEWTRNANPEKALGMYAKFAGLSDESVTACLNDEALQMSIIKRRTDAQNDYNIQATPSFVIVQAGNKVITGAETFEEFEKKLEKYLK